MPKVHLKKYYSNEDYFFSTKDHRILIKHSQQWIKVDPEIFTKMERACWNTSYSDNQYSKHTISLDKPASENDESTSTHLDMLPAPSTFEPETAFNENFRSELLHSAIKDLCAVQQQIIHGLFFDDLTERDLAEMLGVTQPAIHHHKKKALQHMREYLEEAEYER